WAREHGEQGRPRWPMIVLVSPKGWTGPKQVDGKPNEGSWRSHQVPLTGFNMNPDRISELENWLRSYRPEELFDDAGRPLPKVTACIPAGTRRMGANPHANGGALLKDLRLPDYHDFAVDVPAPGSIMAEATRELGKFLREVMRRNMDARNFRVVGPDETASNRLNALFEVTDR